MDKKSVVYLKNDDIIILVRETETNFELHKDMRVNLHIPSCLTIFLSPLLIPGPPGRGHFYIMTSIGIFFCSKTQLVVGHTIGLVIERVFEHVFELVIAQIIRQVIARIVGRIIEQSIKHVVWQVVGQIVELVIGQIALFFYFLYLGQL